MLGFGLGLNKWRRIGGGFVGLLDLFPNAAAAYSLRKLRAAYSGAAVRVRRSSDNTEQDIGFDANGDLDTASLLSFVNEDVVVYTSDFTTGNEDLVEVNGTGADGQSIGGVDDAYKFTLSGGSGNHRSQINSTFDLVNTYDVSFEYYIPSGQTINGIRVRTGASADGEYDQTTLDAWTTVTIQDWTPTSSGDLRIYALVTPNSIVIDADGDVFYLKNIVITQTTADGLVTTWYDQSLSNNATQTTAASQPMIVSAGSLVTENGKAAIGFDGGTTYNSLEKQFTSALSQSVTIFGVMKNNDGNKDHFYDGYSNRFSFGYDSTSLTINAGSSISAGAYPTGSKLISNLYNTTSSQLNINGVTESTGNVGTNTMDGIVIGTVRTSLSTSIRNEYSLNGNFQELIIFDSDQSSNRTGIETNINTFYSIYP